jgi:cytoskeletal protein RodZ
VSEDSKERIERQGEIPLEAPGARVEPQPAEKPPESPQVFRTEETVGELLLTARERSGQSLEFMSEETKIPKQNLQYLETDNFEAIPAKVYVKGFLRTYANALGLDAQHVLSKYEVQTGQTHKTKGDHWEIETEVVEEKLAAPKLPPRILVIAAAVIVVVILVLKLAGKKEETAGPPRRTDLKEEILQQKAAPAASPQKVEVAEPPAAVEPMELKLIASPTDSAWIELNTVSIVEQAPETTAFRFMLPLGRSRSFQATEEFIFKKVGNAGGIALELNGAKLPPLGKKGKVIVDHRITRQDLPRDRR